MKKAIKGNAVIGQSGGPTCVINQSLVGVIEEIKKHSEITGLYGALHGVKGMLEEDFIDLLKEHKSTLEIVAQTPSSALGSVRKKLTKEECERLFEIFKKYGVHYFFYIGGNDTAETTHIINEIGKGEHYELRSFHIPKTIDNDLLENDHCPGYGSAAKFVACAFMGNNLDNRALPGIKVNIVMGRHAGFLTAASILARKWEGDGPHLVYVPEVPFDMDQFIADVEKTYRTYGRAVIAASEGIHDEQGNPIATSGERDSHGNIQLSGSGALGDLLAGKIRSALGEKLRVRADTFGYLQRSYPGIYSIVDAKEARLVGRKAVQYAVSGNLDGSVAINRIGEGDEYAVETFLTKLSKVAKHTKSLDKKYIAEEGNNIKDSYLEYVTPLVGELPEIGRLEKFLIPKK